MKKIIFYSIILFVLSIKAQVLNVVSPMNHNGASISYNGTDTLYSHVKTNARVVSLQTVITGSVSGTAGAYASLDGVNYLQIGSTNLTFSAYATNTYIWVIDQCPYAYYAIKAIGTGTVTGQTGTVKGYILPNGVNVTQAVVENLKSTSGFTTDTVTNGATEVMTARVTSYRRTIAIQPVITKVSGTAGGTVTLQGSNDGTNYVTVNTGYISNDVTAAPFTTGGSATLSVSDVTTSSKIFVVRGSPYAYYRLSYAGTGTMVCKIKGYILAQQ